MQENWTGGLNTISNPYQVEPNESRDCLNVVSTERGAIRKRYGSTQFVPKAELEAKLKVTLVSMFPCIIGSTRYLLVASANKIFSVTMSGVVTEIGSGFSSGKWSMVQAPVSTGIPEQGPVYMVNGATADKPQYWTGAGNVKEWTGVVSSESRTDGVINQIGADGSTIIVSGSTGNDGNYTVVSTVFSDPDSDVEVRMRVEPDVRVAGSFDHSALPAIHLRPVLQRDDHDLTSRYQITYSRYFLIEAWMIFLSVPSTVE